jgi:hypothetical protein
VSLIASPTNVFIFTQVMRITYDTDFFRATEIFFFKGKIFYLRETYDTRN